MTQEPEGLLPEHLHPDPVVQFSNWFRDAEQARAPQPEAMTLATADRQGRPSARIVLLRGVDERGFVFFTNYTSRKGEELQANPAAALLFYWPETSRQVRIEGRVAPLDPATSDAYFASRPRGSQLGAHASPQSRAIPDRAFLERHYDELTRKYADRQVPRPGHWGGYRLIPEVIEFWQQGEHRLHDRLRYRRSGEGWSVERLAP